MAELDCSLAVSAFRKLGFKGTAQKKPEDPALPRPAIKARAQMGDFEARLQERLEDIGFYEEVAEAPLSTQLLEAKHCFPEKIAPWALMNPRVGAEGTSS